MLSTGPRKSSRETAGRVCQLREGRLPGQRLHAHAMTGMPKNLANSTASIRGVAAGGTVT